MAAYAKKAKFEHSEKDQIFKSFDEDLKRKLDRCRTLISYSNLVFLKITCANAKSKVSFGRATCDTETHNWPDDGEEVNCMVENLFTEGLEILDVYFNQNKIPENPDYRIALAKLLEFFGNKDHSPLLDEDKKEGEWAIRIAQHLLSKLSVHRSYVIAPYSGCKFESTCPCPLQDNLVGYSGDTSFGYKNGWHGESDIIIEDIPVSVQEEHIKPKPEATNPVNSLEISTQFSPENEAQLKAQTITFSPLPVKFNESKLRNNLVPGLGISTRYMLAYFYDSENDVLLRSDDLLLLDKEVVYKTVIFLWLTLNYKLFCSGLTEEMKAFKAGFFDVIDIKEFTDNIERPLHIKSSEDEANKPKPSQNPACKFKPPPQPSIKFVDV